MVKQLGVAVFIFCLVISGCMTVPKQGKTHVEKEMSLEKWIDHVAVPYLIKTMGENPRFKGESFLLVSMDKDNVEARIDEFTLQLREDLVGGLLTKPGLGLVWRPSSGLREHQTRLKSVQCTDAGTVKYYVGIDASLSSVNGKLNVKIKALDLTEKRWVTGFGVSWQGFPSALHKKALLTKTPDDYLLGLRPLPFNARQADLLAAYLSRNLSCLFSDMERDEVIVYVKKENPGERTYFENAFGLLSNYLAGYREVTVTQDPSRANIIVLAKVHEIHRDLYQVWVSATYKKNQQYVPGRETAAYVSLPMAVAVKPEDELEVKDQKETQMVFNETFDKGLKGWKKHGSLLEIVHHKKQGSYLKLTQHKRRGFTYISRDFTGYSGTLRFEALIQSENVIPGSQKYYRGKFQAVIIAKGKEMDWISDDFEGTFGWSHKTFQVFDLDGSETVVLRIGLQNAKGSMCIDKIKVFHE